MLMLCKCYTFSVPTGVLILNAAVRAMRRVGFESKFAQFALGFPSFDPKPTKEPRVSSVVNAHDDGVVLNR